MRTLLILSILIVSGASGASGPPPPPGWDQPKALPPANGDGQVSFKHGDTALTLPLNQVELSKQDGLILVSLKYIDGKQENKFELYFGFKAAVGKVDSRQITGMAVKSKAGGLSKISAGKSKCDLSIAKITDNEIDGTIACTGMTDMSAQKDALPVQDAKFTAKTK